jgi:hypothetical protein
MLIRSRHFATRTFRITSRSNRRRSDSSRDLNRAIAALARSSLDKVLSVASMTRLFQLMSCDPRQAAGFFRPVLNDCLTYIVAIAAATLTRMRTDSVVLLSARSRLMPVCATSLRDPHCSRLGIARTHNASSSFLPSPLTRSVGIFGNEADRRRSSRRRRL